jgi:hypothetical protein
MVTDQRSTRKRALRAIWGSSAAVSAVTSHSASGADVLSGKPEPDALSD